ncbi:MAG: aminoacyl-tRNA hydrolase [Phycisphaerae bacterium]|nr:aminoacyl-tRNA hydrolase [Phycisphaerae bacterium]|tara:strand:+ start:3461 stop:3883 length:423 start_codon:yes stop_codon:yes gene_type:complete
MLFVSLSLSVPKSEVRFVYGTSSGPGGQHVNRVATKATLLFDVAQAQSLSVSQRRKITNALATRINKAGVLRVTSSKYRSQGANREAVIERFVELLCEAIKPIRKRKKSKVPRSSKKKRLQSKLQRGETKRLRGKVQPDH